METIGDKIRKRLALAGMTATDLAKAAGIHKVSLSGYINNKMSPSAIVLKRIADALGCTVDWFFTDPFVDLQNPDLRAMFEKTGNLTHEEMLSVVEFMDFVRQKRKEKKEGKNK